MRRRPVRIWIELGLVDAGSPTTLKQTDMAAGTSSTVASVQAALDLHPVPPPARSTVTDHPRPRATSFAVRTAALRNRLAFFLSLERARCLRACSTRVAAARLLRLRRAESRPLMPLLLRPLLKV
jgi:hypothetical protein